MKREGGAKTRGEAGAVEKKAVENIGGGGKERVEMKRGLMSSSRTTRDFSSHVEPGHTNGCFWRSCD